MGHIYRLGDQPGPSGSYEAPVHDSGTASRWGSVSWRADVPAGCDLVFRTRSGNSARPDRTWSDWSGPLTASAGSRITSPNARFIQWKVEMSGTGGATPILDSVTLAYLPQNSPPVVHSVSVISQAQLISSAPKSASGSSSAAYSVTVSGDTADTSGNTTTSAGTPTQTLTRAAAQQITVSWQAEDPDGDRLVYSLYFRAEEETQWMLLRSGTHDTSMTFDADILADRGCYFRVFALDRESDPPASACRSHSSLQHACDDRQHAAQRSLWVWSATVTAPRASNGNRPTPAPPCGAANTRSTPATGCRWKRLME